MRLILIRHGQTDYNLQNRYCGFSNPALNKKGIEQAKKLAVKLKSLNVDKAYSSDLKRAFQTAKIIFRSLPIERVPDFREMNFGIFEGLSYEEIIKINPELYRKWIESPAKVKIPDAEGLRDLNKRVKERLAHVFFQNKNKTIAVVTHSGPIKVILCGILRYGLKQFWQIEQDLGALNIIDYRWRLPPLIVKMNDTSQGACI